MGKNPKYYRACDSTDNCNPNQPVRVGYFDTFPPEKTSEMERKLQDFLVREAGDVLASIREKKEIGEETEKLLRDQLQKFVERSK